MYDDFEGPEGREHFAWIEIRGERVGAVQLYEYRLAHYLDSDEFFDHMDAVSSINSDVASTIIEVWDDVSEDLFAYGNVVDFRMAWIDPQRCPPGTWARAANSIIDRSCPTYSLLILKAFPWSMSERRAAMRD